MAKHTLAQKKLQEKAIKDAIKFNKLTRKKAKVLSDQLYNVIYADYSNIEIPFEDLEKLEIPASDNSVLFIWTDNKNLSLTLDLAKHWGFEYQESLIWNYMASSVGKFTKISINNF